MAKQVEQEIIVRNIEQKDLEEVAALSHKCFGPGMSLKYEHMESQLNIFPKGQICVEYGGKIVGCALSLIVNFSDYGYDHTYDEISGDGYIRNHNPEGVNLYGIEVGVDPDYWNMSIGKQLYEARKKICKELHLQSIIIGGRIPNYYQYADKMSAEQYAKAVMADKIYDPVLTFQKKNGFQLNKVIANYLPDDKESLQYATSMEWKNDEYELT
ncbi:GNAT family N-acetyltransferase [Pseudogracilibacillus auburnensis]|uniref:Acetyltransferase (GNAT) family protein n=1 Tax=Pseudogracilibacillus auburnensis TaxID=1494959 RepID=A0A2V3VYB3_9BACI|nr:GNAT family N-acetyltransferase [Pseudogracilibacillus auburnensis]PXW85914.1 acetyltransferase (GNAT) family protein [Pseudogracilibacillus auburnensis]